MFAKVFFAPTIPSLNDVDKEIIELNNFAENDDDYEECDIDLQCNIVLKYLSDYIETQNDDIVTTYVNINKIMDFLNELFSDERVPFGYYMRKDNISIVKFSAKLESVKTEIIYNETKNVDDYEKDIKYFSSSFYKGFSENDKDKERFINGEDLYLFIVFAEIWAKYAPLCIMKISGLSSN